MPHDPEYVARLFHETYEWLAPGYHYEPRRETAVPWSEVPEPNKSLMITVAAEVLKQFDGSRGHAVNADSTRVTTGMLSQILRSARPVCTCCEVCADKAADEIMTALELRGWAIVDEALIDG